MMGNEGWVDSYEHLNEMTGMAGFRSDQKANEVMYSQSKWFVELRHKGHRASARQQIIVFLFWIRQCYSIVQDYRDQKETDQIAMSISVSW